MDPEPEMGAAAAEAAVYDTSPSPPHQNPPPILAESAQPGAFDVAQLFAVIEANLRENTRQMMQGMEGMENNINKKMEGMEKKMDGNTKKMDGMSRKMEANTTGMREEMKKMRGEMRKVGQCLQAGKMATPRAMTSELADQYESF